MKKLDGVRAATLIDAVYKPRGVRFTQADVDLLRDVADEQVIVPYDADHRMYEHPEQYMALLDLAARIAALVPHADA